MSKEVFLTSIDNIGQQITAKGRGMRGKKEKKKKKKGEKNDDPPI